MTQDQIVERDGVLVGPLRRPVNPAQEGSIHDDGVAQKLGFRGGTIAGSIHMEQFPPLLLHAFGPAWLETGSLSLYFLHATLHAEPVRCLVELPPPGLPSPQTATWMDDEHGTRVCEGTASIGAPEEPSALRERLARLRPPGELRMLAQLQVGQEMSPRPARLPAEALDERLKVITEPLDAYRGDPRWEGRVLTPVLTVQALRRAEAGLAHLRDARAIGLFGAIEIRHHRGPVYAERDYVASGRVLAVGETPKTEYFWYESQLDEAGSGARVASMIMMLRFMKASSPLWQSA